jgi:hypothetical protein
MGAAMLNKLYVPIASFCLLGAMAWTTPVRAEDQVLQPAPVSLAPVSLLQSPFGGKALDQRALATLSGGMDVINDMKLKGIVSDNQAFNLTTGNNAITEGSFAGASGLPTVIQNTGNNVLIQNATIVNVQIK